MCIYRERETNCICWESKIVKPQLDVSIGLIKIDGKIPANNICTFSKKISAKIYPESFIISLTRHLNLLPSTANLTKAEWANIVLLVVVDCFVVDISLIQRENKQNFDYPPFFIKKKLVKRMHCFF